MTTIAIIGAVVYVFFHRVIGHILHIAGMIFEITLITCAATAAAVLLVWTTRSIQRRRAAAGGCAQCRFRCQQPLTQRPHLPVVQITGRQAGPVAALPQPAARPGIPLARRAARAAQPARATQPVRPAPWPAAVPLPAAVSLAATAAHAATPVPCTAAAAIPAAPGSPAVATLGQPRIQVGGPVSHGGYLLTPDGVTSAPPADQVRADEPALDHMDASVRSAARAGALRAL
jgi:hypothetical protein